MATVKRSSRVKEGHLMKGEEKTRSKFLITVFFSPYQIEGKNFDFYLWIDQASHGTCKTCRAA